MEKKITDNVSNSNKGKDKLDFVIDAIVLSTPNKGGYTKELVEVFERYRKKFGLYGVPKKVYSTDGGTEKDIEYPYNMSAIFYHISPNNKTLDAFYEANKNGISNWFRNTKGQKYIYEYLATKQGYLEYAKQVNPNSPYILKVDYEVTANQLYRDYNANEVAADNKYKGKKLAVSGIIGNLGNDIMDNSYITLKTGDFIISVQCYLEKDIVANLQKGQKVTVIGKCTGLFGTVSLKNCKIWEE